MSKHDVCQKMAEEIIGLLTKHFLICCGMNISGLGGHHELTNYLLKNAHKLQKESEWSNKPKPFKGWGGGL